MAGKCEYFIPDCFYPMMQREGDEYISHEAICILNPSEIDVTVDITLYFEDRAPMTGFITRCPALRTHHIRMDRLKSVSGEGVPQGVPYAARVRLSAPAICQYSRCDTTQQNLAFISAMAYSE